MEGKEEYLLDFFYRHICKYQVNAINSQTIVNKIDTHIGRTYLQLLENGSEGNATELVELLDKQVRVVTDYVYDVCDNTYVAIEEYFKEKCRAGECLPRVCVKTIDNDKVVDLYRINGLDDENQSLEELSANSAFANIFDDKKKTYVHVPDIPKMALGKHNAYKNSRLDMQKVAVYFASKSEKTGFNDREISETDSIETYFDAEWAQCFLSVGTTDYRAFYKSTFISAILLDGVTYSLDSECKKILKSSDSTSNRFVFGYLCFDHMLEDFFEEDEILRLGSMFADLISIPMALQSACIHNSETFHDALKFLNDHYGSLVEKYPTTLGLISVSQNNTEEKKLASSKKKAAAKKKPRKKVKATPTKSKKLLADKGLKADSNAPTYNIKAEQVNIKPGRASVETKKQTLNIKAGRDVSGINQLQDVGKFREAMTELGDAVAETSDENTITCYADFVKEASEQKPNKGVMKSALDSTMSALTKTKLGADTITAAEKAAGVLQGLLDKLPG